MPKSYKPDPEVAIRFDIDAIIIEVLLLKVFRGFWFLYYPRSNRNLNKLIHVWFYGQCLYIYRYIRFGEAIHAQDLEIYIVFPFIPLVKEIFLTEDQYVLWINKVVLPSLRSILFLTLMQYFPATCQDMSSSKV
jgi:hypothetical protein